MIVYSRSVQIAEFLSKRMQYVQEKVVGHRNPMMSLIKTLNTLKAEGNEVQDLGFGRSPFPVPEFARDALRKNADKAEYTSPKGLLSARQAIVSYHSRLDGLSQFDPEDVIIGPGSAELIFLLINVLRGDVYLFAPTWPMYMPQATWAGKTARVIEKSGQAGWKITPDLLEPHLKDASSGSMLVFCNPDNPTGACYSEGELQAIAEVIRKYDVIVLSDEIYARLSYNGNHTSLSKFIPKKTIISSGISQWACCNGWRLGYQMYPKELRPVLSAVTDMANTSYLCYSAPLQYAANSIMKFDSQAADHVFRVRQIYGAVARYCCKVLSQAGVEVVKPRGPLYIFSDFEPFRQRLAARDIRTSLEMCVALLKEAKIAIQPGSAFLHCDSRLTARISLNNFDGKEALLGIRSVDCGEDLPDDFVETYCKETVKAVMGIAHWLRSLSA